jgi:hypothetical protein
MDFKLEKRVWWNFLEEDIQELLKESVLLLDKVGQWDQTFHDYSFVVFPAAKAYEGYLKKIFLERGFITKKDYYGKRFRVGKSLNPSLDRRFRKKESVYDRIVDFCGGKDLANKLWDTWKTCRNILFHWFPDEKNAISFEEAQEKVLKVIDSMDISFKECKIK